MNGSFVKFAGKHRSNKKKLANKTDFGLLKKQLDKYSTFYQVVINYRIILIDDK